MATSPIFSLVTDAAEKMFTATGGVMVPTTLEMETIMPKWMMSTPRDWAMGHSTGTSSTAVAMPSRKVPKISRMMATTRQKVKALRFMLSTRFTRALEMPE